MLGNRRQIADLPLRPPEMLQNTERIRPMVVARRLDLRRDLRLRVGDLHT